MQREKHMDSRWFALRDIASLPLTLEEHSIKGADVELVLSPYDVPEAIRTFTDGATCVIEFKYTGGPEPLEESLRNKHVVLKLGKNSRRLYRIEISNSSEGCVNLHIYHDELNEGLDRLLARGKSYREKGNYVVAKNIIARQENMLLAECAIK